MDDFGPILLVLALIGFLGWALYESAESNKRFEAKMLSEYTACIDAKESEYTCKAYVASQRAQRSADSAETAAYVGMGMAIGSTSSKR